VTVKFKGSVSQATIKTMKEKHNIDLQPVDEIGRKPDAVAERAAELKKESKVSRASLMAQAKAKGIKYFRILSKTELEEVLNSAHQERIDQIIVGAIKRWKKVA
jgi:hypothetical protein